MDKVSLPQFASILNGLAEVFGAKQLTPKALEIWADMFREFDTPAVFSVLNSWPKSHAKFPTPNEVWKAVNEVASRRREDVAETDKKALTNWQQGTTPHARVCMAEIRRIMASPKPDPRTHYQRILQTQGLPDIAYRYAQQVVGKRHQVERVPGQDDEELVMA